MLFDKQLTEVVPPSPLPGMYVATDARIAYGRVKPFFDTDEKI